jgi:hypothetical protein
MQINTMYFHSSGHPELFGQELTANLFVPIIFLTLNPSEFGQAWSPIVTEATF